MNDFSFIENPVVWIYASTFTCFTKRWNSGTCVEGRGLFEFSWGYTCRSRLNHRPVLKGLILYDFSWTNMFTYIIKGERCSHNPATLQFVKKKNRKPWGLVSLWKTEKYSATLWKMIALLILQAEKQIFYSFSFSRVKIWCVTL